MSIDLGQLLDIAGPLAEQAITTSGTHGTITRPDPDAEVTVNPTTLAVTTGTPTPVASGPAIVIAGRATDQPAGPDLVLAAGQYRILMLPSVVDVQKGDLFTVTASRDPELVDRELHIDAVLADTPGVVRVFQASEQVPS